MDDLFAAIAAHLRRHNARLRPAPVERVWLEALRPLARCRLCQAAIVAGEGDAPAYAALLAAGRCLACYLLHEAA